MKFLQLKITNFLTIGNAAPIFLDGKGLVLIQGINEDDSSATSNGVGKSSIPDALCWCLYGATAREVTGDAVVNITAKKNTSVSVTLQDGDTLYQIARYRKHKEFKNQTTIKAGSVGCAELLIDMAKGTEKETQEVINGIMGCSHSVFRAAIYAGQEDAIDLPKQTDKQLKLLIEEAAGVERLEGAYMKAREKLSGAKALCDRYVAEKAMFDARLTTNAVMIAENKLKSIGFEEGRAANSAAFLAAANATRTEMIGIVTKVKLMGEPVLKEEADRLDAQLADHAKVVAGERELADAHSRASNAMNRCLMTAESAKKVAMRVKGVIDNAPAEILKPCPECGKPHTTDELAEYVDAQKVKLTDCVEQAKKDGAAALAATRLVESAAQDLTVYREKMPDVTAVSLRKRELQTSLSEIAALKGRLQVLKKDYDMGVERSNVALTEANPSASIIEHLIKNEETITTAISEADVKIATHQDKVSLYENVVKVFGPAGVRAHILDSVTPFLNERTADYLSALSDGNITAIWSTLSTTAKGDLREKFNIEVDHDKGADCFAGLSGGEKRKVRLSTMLALQDLVASRATKPIDLWIGDEIDDALDPAGLERLMGVLETKARERGTVLVVSHNELRDWIDNVAIVTKRDGYSTIEGALCV